MDTIFTTKGTYNGYNATDGAGGIHEQREARDVKLGQYGHSNQPSHGIIYMYNYAKQPWKTQALVRDVLDRCYVGADFGQGYLGDEDNGEMSGWQVLSSLGFFPVNMGSGEYAIGSPLYDEATIHLENGKTLTIKANNNSDENVYVQSMTVNGEAHNSSFISSKTLTDGGEIVFNMSATPNKQWGIEGDGTSITTGDEVPNPDKDLTVSSLDVADEFALNANKDTVSGKGVKDITNLFDNNSNNAATFTEDTELYYSFNRPVTVNMMTLTSTKDQQAAAPNSFVLYGSNDGSEWTEITNRDNVEFEWGRYTRPFGVDATSAYQYYKLALKGGTTLSEVELLGDADDYSGITKDLLGKVIASAKEIDQSQMSDTVKQILNDGIAAAQAVVDNPDATQDEIVAQYNSLRDIIKRVENVRDGLEKIEAESFDTSHSSIVNDGTNIGGVKKNTWVGYRDVEFNTAPDKIEVRYSVQNSDGCEKGQIEVRVDSRDGDPLFTVGTTKTGGWNNYVTTTVEIPEAVRDQFIGLHDLYFTFVGNDPVDDKQAYVANVDYFDFMATADKSLLKIAVDNANAVTEKQLENVIPVVVKEFKEARDEANAVYNDANATQKEVNNAFSRLSAVLQKLELYKGDKTILKIALDLANQANLDNVIPVVVKEFNAALQEAKDVYEDENAMQPEINAAFDRLASAMQKLEFFKGDKTALKAFIDKVSGLEATKYTEATWTPFETELNEAIVVYEDENAMQPEVNSAYNELVTAFLNLRLIPDKSLLEDLINKAEGLDSANYTKASYAVVENALLTAKAVYGNSNATQEEVNSAKDVLEKAINSLEVNTPAVDNTVNTPTANTPVNKGDTTVSVKTGDDALVGTLAGLALLSVAGTKVLRKKEND